MRKFLNYLEWGIARLAFAMLILMTFIIVLQVFMRYVMDSSLIWPEELTRYLYVWVSMLAIALVEQRGQDLRVEVLREIGGPKLAAFLDIFSELVNMGFYIVLIWLSIENTILVNDMEQYAITFELPMFYVWIGFPMLFGAALIFAIVNFGKKFCKGE